MVLCYIANTITMQKSTSDNINISKHSEIGVVGSNVLG